jgi:hypothetical protein
MTVPGRRRATRLAVMAVMVTLTGLTLLAQPARRDGTVARLGAIVPAPAAVAPGADTPTRPPRAPAAPAEADEEPAPADVASAERETDPALPAVPEPGDIVVALAPPAEPIPRWMSYVHTSESAQPVGPPPPDGGATASSEGAEGPEPGALYWFGPAGLVRLAMEARR